MKKKYEVIWSEIAEKDLKNIIEYIAVDSPHNAFNIFRKIADKASNLWHTPKRGRVVPELKDQGILQYHELIISPWRIIYRIAEKTVYVLAVFDSRQNIEDILLQRFLNPKS